MFLILTPFAIEGTRNSGDDLIIKSLINLLNHYSIKTLNYKIISIAKSTSNKIQVLEKIKISEYDAILIPGFRVSIENQDILEIRLKYIEKAIINNIPVFAIGCSWCVYPGIYYQTSLKINSKEKALLKYLLNDNKNYVSTRDIFTNLFMKNNNLFCENTGDMALFDKNKIHNKLDLNQLNRIAISLPHNKYHFKDAIKLKRMLEVNFKFEVFIVSHQKLNSEIDFIDCSGNSIKLDSFYKKIDMHIGFRLHGHKWFLKNRKPSFLIAEDGRGWGHLATFNGLGIHAFSLLEKFHTENINKSSELRKIHEKSRVNITLIDKMLRNEINNNFIITKNTLNAIDSLYPLNLKIIKKILGVDYCEI